MCPKMTEWRTAKGGKQTLAFTIYLFRMSSEHWYRNTTWSGETEAAFNTKLARSRSQKAQYLRIQGSVLKDMEPVAAIGLFQRCIDERDDSHIAHAYLDMAHAYYVAGDLESALISLEAAMAQQARQPMFRTSAAYDHAMLVALHERTERYELVLSNLDRSNEAYFASMTFQAESARAVIYSFQGRTEEAHAAAHRALAAEADQIGWIPGHPQVGVMPNSDNPLSKRIRAIAASGGR